MNRPTIKKILNDAALSESEKIDQIFAVYTASTSKLKTEEDLRKAVDDAIADSQKDADGKDYKTKYEAEVAAHQETIKTKDKAYSDYEASVAAKETNAAKQAKLRKQLADDGANPDLVDLLEMKFDLAKIEIDGDKIKGWDALSKPIKEQYAAVFGTTTTVGAAVATPPAGTQPVSYTMDQIKSMTPAQINDNWDKGVKQAIEKGK